MERDGHPGVVVKGCLEREDDDHRERREAIFPTRPVRQAQNCGLMTNNTGTERARLRREHQVEIREIDAHEDIGRLFRRKRTQTEINTDHRENGGQHGREADDRELVRVRRGAQPRALQLLAADAEGLAARRSSQICSSNLRAIDIRARLADDHHQLQAACGGWRGTRLRVGMTSRARGRARARATPRTRRPRRRSHPLPRRETKCAPQATRESPTKPAGRRRAGGAASGSRRSRPWRRRTRLPCAPKERSHRRGPARSASAWARARSSGDCGSGTRRPRDPLAGRCGSSRATPGRAPGHASAARGRSSL